MTQINPSKLDKVMTPEQFEQIVEAIISGKYSWACVLILRFGGYNPLHYIPYRTYSRLIKENCCSNNNKEKSTIRSSILEPSRHSTQINDLSYVETMSEKKDLEEVKGGFKWWFFM